MTRQSSFGAALRNVLDEKNWVTVSEIYERLAQELGLPQEEIHGAWKRNVRNALQRGKVRGDVLWDKQGKYRLPDP